MIELLKIGYSVAFLYVHNVTLILQNKATSNLNIFLLFLGNGYIPTSCLKEILHELDEQLTNEELDMIIEEIDSDGSGTVDFDGMLTLETYFLSYITSN